MARILVLSFFPAFLPARSGGELRLFGLYNALSRNHSVVLLTSGRPDVNLEVLQHNARFKEVRVPKDAVFMSAWSRLAPAAGSGDLSAPSIALASATPGALHAKFLELQSEADVIIHDSPFLVGYDLLLGIDGKPRIYNSYNVEVDIYRELHKENADSEIAQIVARSEQLLCKYADIITVCSKEDGERFRELYDYQGTIEAVPNGIDQFPAPRPRQAGDGLVFIGSAHRPNRTAVEAIVRDLAPAMQDMQFHILGNCSEPGQLLPNVTAHGIVDDQTKFAIFQSVQAAINPMVEGGGSSLKIADLAASGVPLISTRMGVRGFDFEVGQHYFEIIADQSVDAIREALSDPQRLADTAQRAALHVSQNYTWIHIADRMQACVERVLRPVFETSAEPTFLVLNDYNPFASVGGGATRIRGLYEGVCATATIVLLCFSDSDLLIRQEIFGGKGMLLAVPKTAEHAQLDIQQAATHHVSTVDIIAIEQAPRNPLLHALYRTLAQQASLILCEHPYMASLPRRGGERFVYSSQNFETGLKSRLLSDHPNCESLVDQVRRIEEFAVGCSELVVAVSDDDAASFGSNFNLVAPVLVVPNGAEEPAPIPEDLSALAGLNACFLGSAHMPNIEAAQFIVNELAPELPDVQFHIAGSVCSCLETDLANVRLWGALDEDAKSALLGSVQVAINPMMSGSGSNVKVADFLKNGLAVLSTEFGARGYGEIGASDLIVRPLGQFADALRNLAASPPSRSQCVDRRARFAGKLSMTANGRDYAALLADQLTPRKRALFVTYRYNFPQRGGGEVYLNRLIRYLSEADIAVDVLAPKVVDIFDRQRFSSDYRLDGKISPIPVGIAHVRAAKFSTSPVPGEDDRLRAVWQQQPLFEAALFAQCALPAEATGLTWGWDKEDVTGRWSMNCFGLVSAAGARCNLSGFAPAKRLLRVEDGYEARLIDIPLDGEFTVSFNASDGNIHCKLFEIEALRPDDPRPLGLFFKSIKIGGEECISSSPLRPWEQLPSPEESFAAMHAAATATRTTQLCNLSQLRGPYSPELEDYLDKHIQDYDLLITHNTVFRTTTRAIAAAKCAGVPSILVPHVHFEDDYYHFPDAIEAMQDASLCLISPQSAMAFLTRIGVGNVAYHCPGIDTDEAFSADDRRAFAGCYGRTEPFVLVLGRKAQAKGYAHVIESVRALRSAGHPDLRVVMIGPDDDKLPTVDDFVDYLGLVDRTVVRGAYANCELLANMSQSESFGIVILEAGLASRPVVANANCAAFADLVIPGTNGFLVTPENLASHIGKILSDSKLASRLGKAGRRLALDYDWDKQGAKFVTHCLALMERNTKRS